MELQALVSLFRRRWWVVALAFVICTVLLGGYSRTKPDVYQARARLYINVPNAINTRDQSEGVQLSSQLLSSFARIVDSDITTKTVSESLGNEVSPARVRSKVSAQPIPQTLLIEISAREGDPELAARLANEAAAALTTVIDDLGQTETGGVKASIIDRAGVPVSPVSPQPQRDALIGALLGLALGAVAAFGVDALDRTIRQAALAADVFAAPLLCSIPRQRRIASDPLVAAKSAGSPTGEAYRALRTAIRFRASSQQLKTVLVTSAAAGDGKSTIAANLAIAMSLDGARTILIDADLRRTRLGTMFDIPLGPGLTNVLLGKANLADVLVPWSRGLSILQVGTHSLNPSEALGSQAMVRVLEEAKQLADIVIIDAPPVLPVADPAVLAALVDGTIVVSRWGRTSIHAAEATRSMLDNVGADVIGVVFNAEGGGRSANYYRHYSTRPQHRRPEERENIAIRRFDQLDGVAENGANGVAETRVATYEPGTPPTDGG